MSFELSAGIYSALLQRESENILRCNELTSKYGLFLSPEDVLMLEAKRFEALKSSGRVEFGEGILRSLILKFCDSPFINRTDYTETLAALQEMFYYFKSESLELLSDDELLRIMRSIFNGAAQGSLEYLNSIGLETICRAVKGCDVDEGDDEIKDDEYGGEDSYDF